MIILLRFGDIIICAKWWKSSLSNYRPYHVHGWPLTSPYRKGDFQSFRVNHLVSKIILFPKGTRVPLEYKSALYWLARSKCEAWCCVTVMTPYTSPHTAMQGGLISPGTFIPTTLEYWEHTLVLWQRLSSVA